MTYLPISLSVGFLAGLWTYISIIIGIPTWPAFAGWAVYFFTGANQEGIKSATPPALTGFILGHLSVLVNQGIGGAGGMLAILVGIIAFIMAFMMGTPTFALAPAAFLACAVYFGTGDPFSGAIPFFIGLIILGLASTALANLIEKVMKKNGVSQ